MCPFLDRVFCSDAEISPRRVAPGACPPDEKTFSLVMAPKGLLANIAELAMVRQGEVDERFTKSL